MVVKMVKIVIVCKIAKVFGVVPKLKMSVVSVMEIILVVQIVMVSHLVMLR